MDVSERDDTKKIKGLATVGSSLSLSLYAVVLLLCFTSFRLLFKAPREQSNSMRRFLFAYLAFMFSLSTIAVGLDLCLNFKFPEAVFSSAAIGEDLRLCRELGCFTIRLAEKCCVTLAIWAADGFMIWRCTVLYSGIILVGQRIVKFICFIMVIVAIGAGLLYTIPFTNVKADTTLAIFSFITLTINCTVTVLIVGRLLYHRRYLMETLGPGHGSPYLRLIALCIESAALVVKFNVVLIVLILAESQRNLSFILLEMMVHIYVISPFLIIFKVAHDKVYPPNSTSLGTRDAEDIVDRDLKALEFSKEPTSSMVSESALES
ncbi:hypothetical protein CPB84DRAFT_1009711 [Gymnopilus junonius]|uniref:Uncharacterized protein n=1 Tax=Gymnopilus junonius TaxID=109634 RepID=A0A9P5NP56_GYMJU|nr:hypothetical protein CPB84DRAFT_1009711 [Gymnopilus junonius]